MSGPSGVPTAFGVDQARRYDRSFDAPGTDGYALRSRLADTVRLLGPGPGELLDAGMGAGRLCAALAARGWTVSGLDASSEMVALARERLPDAADRFTQAPIERLPYEDARFDVVVATGVLEYSTVEAAIGELGRVLRPGGRAIVSYPNPDAFLRIWKTSLYYPAVRAVKRALRHPEESRPAGRPLVSLPAFRSLLEASGLSVSEVIYTSHVVLLPPLDELAPATAERVARASAQRLSRMDRRFGTQIVFSCARVSA